jgi:hypothetical protein
MNYGLATAGKGIRITILDILTVALTIAFIGFRTAKVLEAKKRQSLIV